MKVGDKISFSDENKRQFTGTVTALKPDRLNQDGKVIRTNLIDVKVSRMPGVFQIYESVPSKHDLKAGEKTFCYESLKSTKRKPETKSTKEKVTSIFKST